MRTPKVILLGLLLLGTAGGCESVEVLWPPIDPPLCQALTRKPSETIHDNAYYAALENHRLIFGERHLFDDVTFYSIPAKPGEVLEHEGTEFPYTIRVVSIADKNVTLYLEPDEGCPDLKT